MRNAPRDFTSPAVKAVAPLIDQCVSIDELNAIGSLLRQRFSLLHQSECLKHPLGSQVAFEHRGKLVVGTVTRRNGPTVSVLPHGSVPPFTAVHRVPPHVL